MQTDTSVAVVILNYNGRHFLERFLPSVVAHSDGAVIIVADNGSTDDSLDWMTRQYPAVRQIALGQNHGFCGGYNRALAQVEARYYVLLNSDIEVRPGWLGPLIGLMEARPEVGACQPKMLCHHDPHLLEYAGAAGGWIDRWGYPFAQGRLFDTLEVDEGRYRGAYPVAWASGAALCIRAECYRQLGGLEESFFAHFEEIDLCWRLWNAGHQVWAVTDSEVLHVGGGTLHKSNPRKTFLNFRNGLAFLYRHTPAHRLWRTIWVRLCLDGLAGIQFVAKGRIADCLAIIRAHWAFYAWLPALQRYRRQHPNTRDDHPGMYQGSIVWDYFVRGRRFFYQLPIKQVRP